MGSEIPSNDSAWRDITPKGILRDCEDGFRSVPSSSLPSDRRPSACSRRRAGRAAADPQGSPHIMPRCLHGIAGWRNRPCRQGPDRREASRPPRRAAYEVRVRHQPRSRQGDRSDNQAVRAGSHQRHHPVTGRTNIRLVPSALHILTLPTATGRRTTRCTVPRLAVLAPAGDRQRRRHRSHALPRLRRDAREHFRS